LPVPGPRNLITDVEGIAVGNAHDLETLTGTTVVLPTEPVVAAVDIRGGASGSRETAALEETGLVSHIHGLVLTGGSVFGLDAASAVTRTLARRGIGFAFGDQPWPCPVIPAAVLFDLMNGGRKWTDDPPYFDLGLAALANAGSDFSLGNAGAGAGAVAGRLKGGLGSASVVWDGYTVGALVAVNGVGSPLIPGTARLWARSFAIGNEMGPAATVEAFPAEAEPLADSKLDPAPFHNTTIAVVATDAILARPDARRFAIMAADGMARALRPVHTPFDGDTVFALATGRKALGEAPARILTALGSLAADTLARAIGRAMWEARRIGRWRALRDAIFHPPGAGHGAA
jgi:L-aminopeptidase/D-esterase-like protein